MPPFISPPSNETELYAAHVPLDVSELLLASLPEVETLVVLCDSKYLPDGITKWVYKWVQNGLKNCREDDLVNRKSFADLHERVERLESMGIAVKF